MGIGLHNVRLRDVHHQGGGSDEERYSRHHDEGHLPLADAGYEGHDRGADAVSKPHEDHTAAHARGEGAGGVVVRRGIWWRKDEVRAGELDWRVVSTQEVAKWGGAPPDRLEALLDFDHRLGKLSRELLGIGDVIPAEARA